MAERDVPSTRRLIDANLNRAAEALRVAEDICRFHWNLEGFAADLKSLRHGILTALTSGEARREDYLAWRDVEGDVGRESPSPPTAGCDLASTAFRNLQRAKEALRTLEEVCRAVGSGGGSGGASTVGELRYRLYAVEKGLGHAVFPARSRAVLPEARLYLLVTSRLSPRPVEDVVSQAVEAGVDVVQLREKEAPDQEVLSLARSLREITARRGAIFIVNDRPDLAVLARADGVHVGQDDLPVAAVRAIVGCDLIVGVSAHSVEQARSAEREGADYIGVGPVFPTPTKDTGPPLGPQGLRQVLDGISVPAFAIGGITPEVLPEIVRAGGRRIAVSSFIVGAQDIAAAVKAMKAGISRGSGS